MLLFLALFQPVQLTEPRSMWAQGWLQPCLVACSLGSTDITHSKSPSDTCQNGTHVTVTLRKTMYGAGVPDESHGTALFILHFLPLPFKKKIKN